MSEKVEIIGPLGRLLVPVEELSDWVKRGYVPAEEGETDSAGALFIEQVLDFSARDLNGYHDEE